MWRLQMAAHLTREQATAVRFIVAVAIIDGLAAGGSYWLTSEVEKDRGVIVGVAVVVGILVALATLFVWAWLVVPRKFLDARVANLEETLASVQGQVGALTEEKFGHPLRWLPVYHALRADVRESI